MSQKPQRVRNAADPEQVENARRRDERSRERYLDDLNNMLAANAGNRRFMWQHLGECGIYRNSFDNSGSVTAFNCGVQSVGQRLLADIMEACPELYLTMQSEAQQMEANNG